MFATGAAVVLCFVLAWILQYSFTYYQMQRFYKRLAVLRRDGPVWIGMEGSAWRRRQYAVLVVNDKNHILHAEQLSGWTVLASLKPIPGLVGRPLDDLFDAQIELPVSKKLLLALRNAAKHIQEAADNKGTEASQKKMKSNILPESSLSD